jgi:hypothetical protein
MVDEVVSGLVLLVTSHVESLLVKHTGFGRISYVMGAKIVSISIYYNTVYYEMQEGEPSICAARGVFRDFINDILRVFEELREGKFLRGGSRPQRGRPKD